MRRLAVAVSLLGLAVLTGCGSSSSDSSSSGESAEKGPIVIGAAIGQSGLLQPFDEPAFAALELEAEKLNAAGGIDGRKIKLIAEDTKSDIGHTPQVAKNLISRGAEVMVVSCDFDFGSPAAIVAQEAEMLSMSLCAQSPKFGVQGIGDKAFTIAQSTNAEGAVLANLAKEEGWKTAYTLLDNTLAYNEGVCEGFTDAFEQVGGEVVGSDVFKNTDSSIASQVSSIKSAPSDVVVLCSIPPGGATALRQIRAAGIDGPIISGGGMDGTYWIEAVPDLSDFWVSTTVSTLGDDPNPAVNQVVSEIEKKTGSAPATGLGVTGYAVMEAIAKAIEGAGGSTDGGALAEQLEGFEDEELLIGPTTFTPDIHVELDRPQAIMRYTNGKPKFEKELPPAVKVGLAG